MDRAPTVSLKVHPIRDYAIILEQTKIVYDNMLSDKYDKLLERILGKKREFDEKAAQLALQDADQALEYGVKAQACVNRMYDEMRGELKDLQTDYQHKLNKMLQTCEEKWRQEHISQATSKQ